VPFAKNYIIVLNQDLNHTYVWPRLRFTRKIREQHFRIVCFKRPKQQQTERVSCLLNIIAVQFARLSAKIAKAVESICKFTRKMVCKQ